MTQKQIRNYLIFRKFFVKYLGWRYKPEVHGAENIPRDEPVLIVGNHRSFIDPWFIGYSTEIPINFAAASFAFKIPLVKNFYAAVGAFSLSLEGGARSEEAIQKAIDILKVERQTVGIFPEGISTIMNPDGPEKVGRFKTGFVRIALEAKVKVVPAAVQGVDEYVWFTASGKLSYRFTKEPKLSKDSRILNYKRVVVRFAKPIPLDHYFGKITKENIDRISGKLRRIITKLYSGEGADTYISGPPFDMVNGMVE